MTGIVYVDGTVTTVVVVDAAEVVVMVDAAEVVEVVVSNLQGPQGVLGPAGPIGPTGAAADTRRHVHTQGVASTDWVIAHTLGGKPSVTVVDSADTHVLGSVLYDSNTQVTVSFTAAFSGFAYLT